MQTKRKLILGFLLAGFGLLAACGNDHTGGQSDNKVAEGGDCDADKKCKDDLKCFKKAAGQTGGTCQKPCDTSNPNACGTDHSKMCMEHELLDGSKDHMCMAPAGPPKTWHSECEISSDPHEMAHACHPLHEKPEGAVCVKLKPSAHATCEKLCENGSPANCATDKNDKKLYECKTIDTKKVCSAIDKQVNAVCKKDKPGTCQTSGPELVCVTQGASTTCQKKCDPNANETGCNDTEGCVEVDSQHICKLIPEQQAGETCSKTDPYACFNPSEDLECVEHNGKSTCQKKCTDSGNECDPSTEVCKDFGTEKACVAKPNKQIGDACVSSETDTCFNANFALSCIESKCQRECEDNVASITTSQCEANQLCNTVDTKKLCQDNTTTKSTCAPVYNKLKAAVPPVFHDETTSILSDGITKTKTDGITKLVFTAGTIVNPTSTVPYAQAKSAMYLDLDSGEAVKITDKDAFDSNKKWDVAFRSYEFYVNGGPFQGDLSIAKVEGSEDEFKSANFASAKKIAATEFKVGAELSNTCVYQSYSFGGGFTFPLSAPVVANGNARWCGYGANFQPSANPNVYYVLKNSAGTWFAKLLIKNIQGEPGNLRNTQFTIQYQVL